MPSLRAHRSSAIIFLQLSRGGHEPRDFEVCFLAGLIRVQEWSVGRLQAQAHVRRMRPTRMSGYCTSLIGMLHNVTGLDPEALYQESHARVPVRRASRMIVRGNTATIIWNVAAVKYKPSSVTRPEALPKLIHFLSSATYAVLPSWRSCPSFMFFSCWIICIETVLQLVLEKDSAVLHQLRHVL